MSLTLVATTSLEGRPPLCRIARQKWCRMPVGTVMVRGFRAARPRNRSDELIADLRGRAPSDGIDGQRPLAEAEIVEQAFTSAWASSKLPPMAMAWTFFSRAVVICRRCTGETRPSGNRIATSMRSRPRKASIAAPPVSPEVAPMTVALAPRSASTWSMRRARNCRKALRRASAWKTQEERVRAICTRGVTLRAGKWHMHRRHAAERKSRFPTAKRLTCGTPFSIGAAGEIATRRGQLGQVPEHRAAVAGKAGQPTSENRARGSRGSRHSAPSETPLQGGPYRPASAESSARGSIVNRRGL